MEVLSAAMSFSSAVSYWNSIEVPLGVADLSFGERVALYHVADSRVCNERSLKTFAMLEAMIFWLASTIGKPVPENTSRAKRTIGVSGRKLAWPVLRAESSTSSGEEVLYEARALWAATAEAPDELTFAKNDLLEIVHDGPHWVLGRIKGTDGPPLAIPANYIGNTRLALPLLDDAQLDSLLARPEKGASSEHTAIAVLRSLCALQELTGFRSRSFLSGRKETALFETQFVFRCNGWSASTNRKSGKQRTRRRRSQRWKH